MGDDGPTTLKKIGDGEDYNWCFLGPDPSNLCLVAKGEGGFDEMVECYIKAEKECSNLFGVLRLDFKQDTGCVMKCVFVRASKSGEEGVAQISVVKRGQAQALAGSMEKAVSEHCPLTLSIQVSCLSEFSLDVIVDKLRKTSPQHHELMTMGSYTDTLAEWKTKVARTKGRIQRSKTRIAAECAAMAELMPVMEDDDDEDVEDAGGGEGEGAGSGEDTPGGADGTKKPGEADGANKPPPQASANKAPPRAANVMVEESSAPPDKHLSPEAIALPPMGSRLSPKDLAKVKYHRFQPVVAYSTKENTWLDDALIMDLFDKPRKTKEGTAPAGTLRVKYNKGTLCRWVLPDQRQNFIRPSTRPWPPRPLRGKLFKEVVGAPGKTTPHYCNLQDGFLQWWDWVEVGQKKAKQPKGQFCLIGMELQKEGKFLCMQTSTSSGMTSKFQAEDGKHAKIWESNLGKHAEHAEAMVKWMQTKDKTTLQLNKPRPSTAG